MGQTKTGTRAGLEQQRRRLSLDAQEGAEGAAKRLEEVERELEELRASEERAALANEERELREAEAEEKRRETDRRKRERKLLRLQAQQVRDAKAYEEAMARLVELGGAMVERGEAMVNLAAGLHWAGGVLDVRTRLADWTSHQLSTVPRMGRYFDRAHESFRGPLVEIVEAFFEGARREA